MTGKGGGQVIILQPKEQRKQGELGSASCRAVAGRDHSRHLESVLSSWGEKHGHGLSLRAEAIKNLAGSGGESDVA